MTPACAYNLFGNKLKPDLFCAVPEDRPVPIVLDGANWRFAGRVTKGHMVPGFSETRARHSVRLNGYFLFLTGTTRGPRPLTS